MRFLTGYADPYNCDENGHGPACLSMDVFEGEIETDQTYYDDLSYNNDARDAAQNADSIAKEYAAIERDNRTIELAGQRAGQLSIDNSEIRQELLELIQELKDVDEQEKADYKATRRVSILYIAKKREELESNRALMKELRLGNSLDLFFNPSNESDAIFNDAFNNVPW